MNILVRNPEIVFVADLTRADAPALVMTTQCEVVMKSGAEGSQMTAVIKDLKVCLFLFFRTEISVRKVFCSFFFKLVYVFFSLQVVACPFLAEKRRNNVTTVLQPCQVFFQRRIYPASPETMDISINALMLKVTALHHGIPFISVE